MIKILTILLWLSAFLVPCAAQRTATSALPATNAVSGQDRIVIDTTNSINGNPYTEIIAVSNLVKSAAVTNSLATVALLTAQSNSAATANTSTSNALVTSVTTSSNSALTQVMLAMTALSRTTAENSYWQRKLQVQKTNGTQFIELFNNLSSWTTWQNVLAQSNRCVGDVNGASANRIFQLGPNDSAMYVAYINAPNKTNAADNALIVFGVNADAAGSSPSGGGNNSYGIGLVLNSFSSSSTFYQPIFWNNGSGLSGSVYTNLLPTNAVYKVEVTVDPLYISFILCDTNHTFEARKQIARTGVLSSSLNNVWFWATDSRVTVGGTNINGSANLTNVAALKGFSTWNPKPWIASDTADWVIWTGDASGNKIRMWVPFTYDPDKPARLMYHGHGATSTGEQTVWDQDPVNERPFHQSLVSSGIIEVASDQGGNTYGTEASIVDVSNAINYARTNFSVSSLWLMGESFGGPCCLGYINHHYADVAGYLSWFSVCNMFDMYTNGWNAQINGAFGITGVGTNTYANLTTYNGQHDPILVNPAAYGNVPMLYIGSLADTTVVYNSNGVALASLLSPTNANAISGGWTKEQTKVFATGGHGDPSNYGPHTNDVLNFMDRNSITR